MKYDAGLLGFHCIYGLSIGEALAKLYHALGEANLSQLFIVLFSDPVLCWSLVFVVRRGVGRRIVHDLVLERFVCCTQGGVING